MLVVMSFLVSEGINHQHVGINKMCFEIIIIGFHVFSPVPCPFLKMF